MPTLLDKADYRSRLYSRYLSTTSSPEAGGLEQAIQSRRPYLFELIDRFIPKDRALRLLDLGCGHGALMTCLKERGYLHVEGVDTSADQVETAHQHGLLDVRCDDLLTALKKSADEAFDVIIAFDVLEHFTKEEAFEITEEVQRVLKPNGKFVLHVPNAEAIFAARVRYSDLTHEWAFTSQSMRQLMTLCGFKQVHCFEDILAVHGLKSAVRKVLWMGIRQIYRFIHTVETGDARQGILLTQNLLAVCSK